MFSRKKNKDQVKAEAEVESIPTEKPTVNCTPETESAAFPNEAQVQRVAAGAKLVSAAFGEIVTLLMRAPGYKHYTLADLEWLAIPPLLANQFTLAEARSKETGLSAPVGIALWARVSDEVDARLSTTLEGPFRLRPDEWRSGDNFWLVDVIGPPKIVQVLLKRLREQDFKGRNFKLRARDEAGNPKIQVIDAMAPEAEA